MALKLITAPAVEPITLAQAKIHLRVDTSDENDYITSLIKVARAKVEQESLHSLITQTWDLYLDRFPASSFALPNPPLQSVTGIYYAPLATGVEVEYSADNYYVDEISKPGWVVLASTASWPADELVPVNGVRIRFVCGFGDAATNVDPRAIQAMYLLIGHYYENREAVFMGRTTPEVLPEGVDRLLDDLRASVMEF